MQVDSKSIESLFPKYKSLFQPQVQRPNQQLEYFIKEQLPQLIKILQNLDSTFTKLTHTHNTLIMKKIPAQTLFQSFVRKVGDKVQRYFSSLDDVASREEDSSGVFDFQRVRLEMRQELEGVVELLGKKLGGKMRNIQRSKEEEIAMSLYSVIEYYQWTKSDITAISSKFRLDPSSILRDVKSKSSPSDPFGIVSLEFAFKDTVMDYVNKKCRPFLQKRDFLVNKIKQICRETDSRSAVIPSKQYLRAVLTRQAMRCDRDIIKAVQQQVKSLQPSKHYDDEIPQINEQLAQIKTEFQKLKNSNYYLDIIRGNFIQTYQMQTKKLQNVFTIGRLEKYLQEVYAVSERMRVLLDRIIDNRKGEKLELGDLLETAMDKAIDTLQMNFKAGTSLGELSSEELSRLRVLLQDLPEDEMGGSSVSTDAASRYREEQKARERERQSRIAAERQRRQDQARKRKEQLEGRAQRERQNRQAKKVEEQERQVRLEQERHQREQKRRVEAEKARIRAEQDKIRKMREQEDERKRRQQEEETRRRQVEDRRKEQEALDQKRKQEAAERQKQLDEEKRIKAEKDKEEREKQKRIDEEKKREREAAEEKRKQQLLKKEQEKQKQLEEEKRIKAEKDAEQKKKDQERRQADQARIQRQKQQAKKRDQQRLQRQADQKKRKDQEKRELERKQKERIENEKKERQRLQNQRKEKDRIQREKKQRQRIQNEKRQQERKQQERIQKQKKERERIENQKKEKERIEQQKKEKQRLEKERLEKERLEKQKLEKQRIERQNLQKEKDRQQKERLQQEKKQKLQFERKEKQRKQRQEQERKEKERKQKQRLDQQKKQQERKEQQRKQKEKKQQQEKLRLQEQKKKKDAEASSKAGSTKPSVLSKDKKKSGGFDYSNMYEDDDDDDIVDQDAKHQKPVAKPPAKPTGPPVKAPAKKDDDFEFLQNDDVDFGMDDKKDEYEDDFEPPENQGEQPEVNVDTKELISQDNLKLFNDYLKGSQYARKNKVNLEPFNNFRHFVGLFEEFVQNREIYFFEDDITREIFELPNLVQDMNAFNEHAKEIHKAMRQVYSNDLQMIQFNPETKYIFPVPFENPLAIKVVEFLPGFNEFNFVLEQPLPQSEQHQEYFDALIDSFCFLFGVSGQDEQLPQPQILFRVLTPQNLTILTTFDKYLPIMLVIFNYIYETKNGKGIVIDQYTIQRFFYASHSMDHLYKAIETQGEQLDEFFGKMCEKFSGASNILVNMKEYTIADPNFTQAMVKDFKTGKDAFLKSPAQTILSLFSIDKVDGNLQAYSEQDNPTGNSVIYIEMTKASPKPILNIYLFATDEESNAYNQKFFEILMAEEDPRFETGVFLDYTRHNGLYEYCSYTLPLWAHVMTKKKMKAQDALAVLNFSMLPIYSAYKNQD